jgi:hypothetical protein
MKRKPAMSPLHMARRVSVLDRLTEQLKSGVKNQRVVNDDEVVPLTDKDKTRIEKEIAILKTRV